jgi:hypothetical protein
MTRALAGTVIALVVVGVAAADNPRGGDDHAAVREPFAVTKVCFCSEVTVTGRYKELPKGHGFKAKDLVWLYVEAPEAIADQTCSSFVFSHNTRPTYWYEVAHLPRPRDDPATPVTAHFLRLDLRVPRLKPGDYTMTFEVTSLKGRREKVEIPFRMVASE